MPSPNFYVEVLTLRERFLIGDGDTNWELVTWDDIMSILLSLRKQCPYVWETPERTPDSRIPSLYTLHTHTNTWHSNTSLNTESSHQNPIITAIWYSSRPQNQNKFCYLDHPKYCIVLNDLNRSEENNWLRQPK